MRALFAITLILGLAACTQDQERRAGTQGGGGGARVDMQALVQSHPLSAEVRQLDRDIATLETARAGNWQRVPQSIGEAGTSIGAQLDNAHRRAQAFDVQPPSRRHVTAIPRRDDRAGQIGAYEAALNARETRALSLREAQAMEKESSIEYQFDRAHAGERLRLRLRAATLRSDRQADPSIVARLKSLDSQERSLVDDQRAKDRADLAAYRAALAADTSAQLASMQRDITAHGEAARAIPRADPQIVGRAGALPEKTDRARTAAAFALARDDLAARFADLHSTSAGDSAATVAEIAALRAERAELENEMRAEILAVAREVALERKLGDVVTEKASSGVPDITDPVRARMRSRYTQ